MATLLTSCYKDLSTEATMTIPDINVVVDREESFVMNFGDSLIICPNVSQEGRAESDLSFLWEKDVIAGDARDIAELSSDRDLRYLVRDTPDARPYTLSLTVTDNTTGYSVIKTWEMFVTSSIGEGLVVAHTKDGGKTSELDLISNKAVTYGYSFDEAKVTRDLFLLGNDCHIDGRVMAMSSRSATETSVYNLINLMVGTDQHLYALSNNDYSIQRKDAELFASTVKLDTYATEMLFNYDGYQFAALMSGQLYGCQTLLEFEMGKYPGNAPRKALGKGKLAYSKIRNAQIAYWNPNEECFYAQQGWMAPTSGLSKVTEVIYPFYLSGSSCLFAQGGYKNILYFIMLDSQGKRWLMGLNANNSPMSAEFYQLDALEGIDKAANFCFVDSGSVFFYTVDNKIYYNIVSGKTVTGRASTWAPESPDEVVTGIEEYMQAWYGTRQLGIKDYEYTLSTNCNQLIITTYNSKTGEGKVYLQAFAPATGRIAAGNNGIFGGFGEITAMATTYR